MGLKVVGAGLGRTGTHSLKLALEQLTGEPCYHMVEVFQHMDHCPTWTAAANGNPPEWNEFLKGYGSAVDWPACAFWKEMSDANPNAIVLLSIRDSEEWYASASSTIFNGIKGVPDTAWREMVDAVFKSRTPMDIQDKASCISAFDKHNDAVIAGVPASRLVVWNPKEGWAPLCKALSVPIPDGPFPVSNTREEFVKRLQERASQA